MAWKKWVGHAMAVAMGIGFVLLIEGGLRLLPSLAPPPLLLELARNGAQTLRTVNPDYAQRYFGGSVGGRALDGMRLTPQPFVEGPERRPLRLVFAGGSTVQGYPYPARLAAAAYLEQMAGDLWPGRSVEVFNLGITAVSSFAVARTVEDAMRLEPDAVVVYSGHNEFYGVYGAASLQGAGESIWSKKFYYRAMQWRTSALLSRLLSREKNAEGPPPSLLKLMAEAGRVGADDPRRPRAERNLRDNIDDIVALCRDRGVPLVLCTLVSNEAGFAPAPVEELPLVARQADSLLAQGDFAPALDVLETALPEHAVAGLHFARGRALEGLGRGAEAREAYRRARDLDTQPWRAPSAFNRILRQAASAPGVYLADVEAAFAAASGPAGVGWDLMDDHLHPSAAGQALLARSIAGALQSALSGATGPLRADDEYRRALGHTPLDEMRVRRAMAALLSEKPMDRSGPAHVEGLVRAGARLWASLSQPERRAFGRWLQGKGQGELALNAADELFAAGEYDLAARYYAAARRERPFTVLGDLWATLRRARCRQLLGALDATALAEVEAAEERAVFLAQAPGADAAFGLFFTGYARHLQGRADEAARLLEKAAAYEGIRRDFIADLLPLLAENLAVIGRSADAEAYIRALSGQANRAEFGRRLLAELRHRGLMP